MKVAIPLAVCLFRDNKQTSDEREAKTKNDALFTAVASHIASFPCHLRSLRTMSLQTVVLVFPQVMIESLACLMQI